MKNTSNCFEISHTKEANVRDTFEYIYNGNIFPSLNPAKRTPIIGQWTELTWSVAVLPRKTRAMSLLRHKITSKYYEVGQENWHFTFIEMRPFQAFFRENFKTFFVWGF